jgi:predicted MFS family arabinose efflux permease
LKWKLTPAGFACDFIIAGILAVSASILLLGIKTDSFPKHKSWKERFVFKKKYSIYYMLEIFFGARKQVFMTFGFWVMVAVLKKSPEFIGKVMLCAGVLGIFFKPFVGKLVQKYSERKVLIIDGILLFFICMLYAFSMEIFNLQTATLIISACFVFDNLLFAVSTARASYIAGIAEKKEDITPSLYSGMALNHISSILGAVIGGYIWHLTSYSWTFVFTAVLAVCSSLTALKIKYRRETPA